MQKRAEISRNHPTCFIFMIDRSASMAQPITGGDGKKKAEFLCDTMNKLLQSLVLRCARDDGIRDYFHVGVLAYNNAVTPAFGGPLAGHSLVPISDVGNNPLRVEQRKRKVDDGAGGFVEQTIRFPVWFEPVASGKTKMCQALDMTWSLLSDFLLQHPSCYPPMAINITDGEATDGDPEISAGLITNLASEHGKVLLFNLHISNSSTRVIEYPEREEALPDALAQRLFRMSSVLPDELLALARQEGYLVAPGARGFVYNADLSTVVKFLQIGTHIDSRMMT